MKVTRSLAWGSQPHQCCLQPDLLGTELWPQAALKPS